VRAVSGAPWKAANFSVAMTSARVAGITPRERFIGAARRKPVDRPPVWLMRQAGRYLPEYRALREGRSFMDMVRTPDLAAEITCQPIRRFDFDAAVIFSDILVPVAAMGRSVHFEEGRGPIVDPVVRTRAHVDGLEAFDPERSTGFVGDAIRLVRRELGPDRPIIGFCGGPFTVASYMVEGRSSRDFTRVKGLLHGDRATFTELLSRVVEASIPYLGMQVEAGADALQIFESWGGALDAPTFCEAVLPHVEKLIVCAKALGVPVILYVNGGAHLVEALAWAGPDVLSLDWRADVPRIVAAMGDRFAFQGNMDPGALFGTPEAAAREATRVLDRFAGASGHIFNLGSGILPETPIACVEAVVAAVRAREAGSPS
jgi:uroporphyrinogen decarboxylase